MSWMTQGELSNLGLGFLGREVLIETSVLLINPQSIKIGSHSRIDAGVIVSAAGGSVQIGKHVHLGARSIIQGGGGVVIQDFCGLSFGVVVLSSSDDFLFGHLTNPTVPDSLRRVTKKLVVLEKHAVVGANSVISPGVVIGFGASVGSLCKVTRSVRSGGIVSDSSGTIKMNRDLKRLEHLESQLDCDC